MISLIWAMDLNHLIGKNNQIPWHYSEDLKYYKSICENKIVLMGDNTYYSLKGYYKTKPLPYQKIYVASLNKFSQNDAIWVESIDDFMKNNQEDIIVVGGKTIYQKTIKYASKLYITLILKTYQGDTYFNDLDLSDFDLVSQQLKGELLFLIYERKK